MIKNPKDEKLLTNIKIKKTKYNNTHHDDEFIIYTIYLNGVEIGSAIYELGVDHIAVVHIESGFQRKGLATYLYDYIEQDQGIKLKSDASTKKGKAFWDSRMRKNPKDGEILSGIKIKKNIQLVNVDHVSWIEYEAWLGNKRVGIAYFLPDQKFVEDINIIPSFRRKGVASLLYDYIEEDQKIKLKPSNCLLDDGEEFWKNRLKKNPELKKTWPPKVTSTGKLRFTLDVRAIDVGSKYRWLDSQGKVKVRAYKNGFPRRSEIMSVEEFKKRYILTKRKLKKRR